MFSLPQRWPLNTGLAIHSFRVIDRTSIKQANIKLILWIYLGLFCLTPLSPDTTISVYYMVTVSFIGGGNWTTRRKPPTCHKSLTPFFT